MFCSFLAGAVMLLATACSTGKRAGLDLWSPPMPEAIEEAAPELDLRLLERMIHEEANQLRKRRNRTVLAWSSSIASVARAHSQNMADYAYFGHTDREGRTASERAAEAGITGSKRTGSFVIEGLGENLFATHRYSEYVVQSESDDALYSVNWKQPETIAREAVRAWLDSPRHRENLLSRAYTEQGIGIALGSNGVLYVTQNLH